MGIKRALWSRLRKHLTIVNANFRIIPFLIVCTIFLTGFAFGEIPDLEILPPVCGAPSSNYVVFYQTGKDYFEVLDAKTNTIKKVTIPFDENKISPLWSYDDYVFFQTEKSSYRYDIIKNIFQEFPRIHNAVYFNYNTNILVRNLYNFDPNTVQLQKEKYDPEKKTFTILKTWPKHEQSWCQFGRDFFIITNQDRSLFVDLKTGIEKTLEGKTANFYANGRQVIIMTDDNKKKCQHLYQIDLSFRGTVSDLARILDKDELNFIRYGISGYNSKTFEFQCARQNEGKNSIELWTLSGNKFKKKDYFLPKDSPYKFYQMNENDHMQGGFGYMYGDLMVFWFQMSERINDDRFVFLDTKKYDQLPEDSKKDAIVFEFKGDWKLNQIRLLADKFYIMTDTRLYCYDYDYNLLWKKLCPKYRRDIQYNGNIFNCYSIFNNETLKFDMYVKEFENENLKNLYLISPGFVSENEVDLLNFVLTKHGVVSLYTTGYIYSIRLYLPNNKSPVYDIKSKNNAYRYESRDYDGEDILRLKGRDIEGDEFVEVFNIKLGQFVE